MITKHTRILLLTLALLTATWSSATCDWLAVNHTTKQLFWGDEDHPVGYFGWQGYGDGSYEATETKYLALGYSFTDFPFLIETIALAIIMTLIFGLVLVINRKNSSK